MKIIATADLHYDNPRSVLHTRRIAERIVREHGEAEVLIVAGDLCGLDLSVMDDCLMLFDDFAGRKLMVAGNHDLWSTHADSFERYEKHIPRIAADRGFTCLDAGPVLVGDVGFAGTIGWYDYSFRDKALGVPMRFYEAKTSPGAARALCSRADDVPEALREITVRWMDGRWVHLGMSDPEFTELLCDRLAEHLAAIAPNCRTIVGVSHHVPFRRTCPEKPLRRISKASWAFTTAFMGSGRIGETFAAEPKVRTILCGHTHMPSRMEIGGVDVIDIGSSYTHKRFVELDV